MNFTYKSTDEAFNDPDLIKENLCFITGRSASGKTTFANKFKDRNYHVIEFDQLFKSIINLQYNLSQDESIDVLRGKAPVEIEDDFVRLVRAEIKDNINSAKVIVEGTISSIRVLDKIFSDRYSQYTFVFLYPGSREEYKQRVMKRFKDDIATNSQTLPIWDSIEDNIIQEFKSYGFDSKKVKNYIDTLVENFFAGSEERYKMFEGKIGNIVTIRV